MLFFRHAEISGDPYAEPELPAEGHLSGLGEAQALALGRRVADIPIDVVWASSYGRALRTAHLAMQGRGLEIRRLEFLREWLPDRSIADADATRWESMSRASAGWHAEEIWKTELGEGCLEMVARVGPPFLRELAGLGVHARHGGYVVEERAVGLRLAVFAHGGSLGALLGFLLGLPPFPVSRFSFELTGMARIRLHRQKDVWYPQLVVPA